MAVYCHLRVLGFLLILAIATAIPAQTPQNMQPTQTPDPEQFFPAVPVPKELNIKQLMELTKSIDSDGDGISNYYDKCIELPSKNNRDRDGDGWGDPCDGRSADVSISLTAPRRWVRVGSSFFSFVTIKNYGPHERSGNINVGAYFSTALRIDWISTSKGECDDSALDGWFECEGEDLLAVGEKMIVKIRATAMEPGHITNTVKVTNGFGDLYRRNNHATLRLNIVR